MRIFLGGAGPQTESISLKPEKEFLDPAEAFRAEMLDHGLDPGGVIIKDAKIHKFSTKESDSRDTAGWYVFFQGNVCGGSFGDFRSGIGGDWCSKKKKDMTQQEKIQYERDKKEVDKKKAIDLAKRLIEYDAKAIEAQALYDAALPYEEIGHTYPDRKGVDATGYKVHVSQIGHKALLIPRMRLSEDKNGLELRNVEHIWENPNIKKHGLTDAETSGTFHVIQAAPGNVGNIVYIGEGFSTCKTISETTGSTAVCSFNAGNMPNIAESVRAMFPGCTLVVAGDDDQFTVLKNGKKRNAGRIYATKTAEILGVPVVFPEFKDLFSQPTDFNDLMMREGKDVVADQLRSAVPAPIVIEKFFDGKLGNFFAEADRGTDEQQFIFSRPGENKPGGLRVGVIGYEGGEGGAGKTRLWFQILSSIAFGHDFTGGAFDFHETGPVYMVAGEDGRDIMAEVSTMIRMRAGDDKYEIPKELQSNFHFRCAEGGKDSPCLFRRTSARNLERTEAFDGLYMDCQKVRPIILVLDSQSIVVGLGEESNEEAGMVSGMLKVFLKFCKSIIIIAHTTKTSTSGKAAALLWNAKAWASALSPEALRGSSGQAFNGRYLKMTTKVPPRFNEELGAKEDDRLIACAIPKANGAMEVYEPFYFKRRTYSWLNNQGGRNFSVLWDYYEAKVTQEAKTEAEKLKAQFEEDGRVRDIVTKCILSQLDKVVSEGSKPAGQKGSPANLNMVANEMVEKSKEENLAEYHEKTKARRSLKELFIKTHGVIYIPKQKIYIKLVNSKNKEYSYFKKISEADYREISQEIDLPFGEKKDLDDE